MAISAAKQNRIKFYIWIALVHLSFSLLHDLVNNADTFGFRVINNLWRSVFVTTVHFVLFEYTIPFIRSKRKQILSAILLALLLIWIHMMLYSFGLTGWRRLGIALGIYTPFADFESMGKEVSSQMAFSMGSVFFFAVILHAYNYIKLKQSAQQLRIEKQEAELSYLRSQTNPHFLFNTLNNIYSLARDKNDLAPESILRLSKILRFMLYETSGSFIAIEQELKIINDYIALEELRYDDSLKIKFNHDVEDMKQAVPPLLLIPLVENAFKHGVSETRGEPFLDIHLSINNRKLTFIVKNSVDEFSGDVRVKENIGLSNLRRQLELLYTDYSLIVQPAEHVFTATLKINLGSHV